MSPACFTVKESDELGEISLYYVETLVPVMLKYGIPLRNKFTARDFSGLGKN